MSKAFYGPLNYDDFLPFEWKNSQSYPKAISTTKSPKIKVDSILENWWLPFQSGIVINIKWPD